MNTDHFKEKLEEELKLVEGELSNIGTKNPQIHNGVTDWEGHKPDMDVDTADDTELGDKFEELEENTAVLNNLETRYNELKAALGRITEGTYGICKVCGNAIEAERLEANPAADTCTAHMNP